MGSQTSSLSEDKIEEYLQLTYLTRSDIIKIYRKFVTMAPAKMLANLQSRFDAKEVIDLFPMIKNNPFRERLVAVFSSQKDLCLSFEDMLDLCSALSEKCPNKVKAAFAFQIFDNDGDGEITADDVSQVLDKLTTGYHLKQEEKDVICDIFFKDADLNLSGSVCSLEFFNVITNIPEFEEAFSFKL